MFVGFDLEEVGPLRLALLRRAPAGPARPGRPVRHGRHDRPVAGGVCDAVRLRDGDGARPGAPPLDRPRSPRASRSSVGLLGTDLLVVDRSDYGPFRARKVPYLFFTTGENPLYHTPRDIAETLDYPKLEAISRMILGVVRQAADRPTTSRPGSPTPDHPFAEAVDDPRRPPDPARAPRGAQDRRRRRSLLMNNTLRSLDAIVARGSITPERADGDGQRRRGSSCSRCSDSGSPRARDRRLSWR